MSERRHQADEQVTEGSRCWKCERRGLFRLTSYARNGNRTVRTFECDFCHLKVVRTEGPPHKPRRRPVVLRGHQR